MLKENTKTSKAIGTIGCKHLNAELSSLGLFGKLLIAPAVDFFGHNIHFEIYQL
jgi:hypothetical protein